MTQDKIDAVCDLHDLAAENNALAIANRGSPESRAYSQKKLGFEKQKKSLVESYKLNPQSAGIGSGNYCADRAKLIMQKQDIAISNDPKNSGQLYPEVERLILANPILFSQVYSAGDQARCTR